MYFESYFFSKEDQVRVKETIPVVSHINDAVVTVHDCLSGDVSRMAAQSAGGHIGILLSGGVDSSLLLALLNMNHTLLETPITCLTAYADSYDQDASFSKKVSHHFGNKWVGCKLTKQYIKDNLPVAMNFPQAGLYITGANLTLLRCLEECQKCGITELWLGTGIDMMFGGGVNPKQLSRAKRTSRKFYDDFWEYSTALLINRFYRFGSPEMEALASKYHIKLVAPFCNLQTILCARKLWASLLFKSNKDKYPIRLLAHQLGVPRQEAFHAKQTLQESSGIFKLLEECMFDEIADLVPDGVSARRDQAYYRSDPYLSLELYLALKRFK